MRAHPAGCDVGPVDVRPFLERAPNFADRPDGDRDDPGVAPPTIDCPLGGPSFLDCLAALAALKSPSKLFKHLGNVSANRPPAEPLRGIGPGLTSVMLDYKNGLINQGAAKMIPKEPPRIDSSDISACSSLPDPPRSSFRPAPEEGVRLLRAFSGIRQAALRDAVIELATKFAASADQ